MRDPTRRDFLTLQWPFAPRADQSPHGTSGAEDSVESSREQSTASNVVLNTELCLAWGGTDCVACYIACPLQDTALILKDGRPHLNTDVCDGCARCVLICRTVNDLGAMRLTQRVRAPESVRVRARRT